MTYFRLLSLLGLLLWGSVSHAQIYGRLKTNWMHSSQVLNSFTHPNMSAVTSATDLDTYTGDKGSRSTFQVVQSRIGTKFKPHKNIKGVFEVDFVDFSQASPTTSTHPRLRRAFLLHQLSDKFSLQIGQDWDLFSPLKPTTVNYVGNYYNAGNISFMRNQVIGRFDVDHNQFAMAIGQAGRSSSPTDTELEVKQRTSLAMLYTRTFKNSSVQLSGITADREFSSGLKKVWGGSFGFTYHNSFINFKSEFYTGEGLSKIALLSLPNKNFGHESGGFFTLEYKIKEKHRLYLGAGVALAESPSSAIYDSTNQNYTNLGAKRNQNIKLGHSVNVDLVKYYTEVTQYRTKYKNEFTATSIELGTLLYF